MAKDLYDFGGADEIEEVIPNEEVVTDEIKTEEPNEEGVANPSNTDGESEEGSNPDDIQPEENKITETNTGAGLETEIDKTTDELDKELKELEDILNGTGDEGIKPEDDNSEVSDKLKEAVTKMKTLVTKIDKLELENAELTKFGGDAKLSPETIIINSYYDKAMKGDEASKNKIKELIANDLGLEVTDQKQIFVSNSISSGTDINPGSSEGEGFGFVM